jgi:hypothetical protein
MIMRGIPRMAGLASQGKNAAASVVRYGRNKPMKTGAMVVGGMGTAGYVANGRRGRGIDKAGPSRPTGMYRF